MVRLLGLFFLLSASVQAADTEAVSIDVVTGGLSSPVAVRNPGDGSDRLFVVEQGGAIRIIDNGDLVSTPFLDISGRVSASGERGLLGLAFHPLYADNGRFFVNYTAGNQPGIETGTTVIAEYQVSADANLADPDSERILMLVRQDFTNHNGGDIHFGPDGYLYIATGDGGSGNDPCNRAQTTSADEIVTDSGCLDDPSVALLGKILRIDVDSTTAAGSNGLCAGQGDGSAEYAVPGSNPFVADFDQCAEIWSYGLRNPFRFSFDRQRGDMWIADVGQNAWEEVNLEPFDTEGGLNYGWKPCEGRHPRGNTDPESVCDFPSVLPVMEYATGSRCSVIGGFRYRGQIDGLRGCYLFGDYCSGEVFVGGQSQPGSWDFQTLQTLGFGLTSFGEDQAGELYLVRSSTLYRVSGPDGGLIHRDNFDRDPWECRLTP